MRDRGCNLECVKKDVGGDIKEFIGPVKIVLVDVPRSAYICKTCYAAGIVLAQMMMAIVTIIVIFYSMSFKKRNYLMALHIFLSTVGFTACIPSGILILNELNGAATPMRARDRMDEHMLLQLFGLLCGISGMIISYFLNFPIIISIHSIFGVAANIIFVLCATFGCVIYGFYKEALTNDNLGGFSRCIHIIHRFLGIFGFLAATICFVCGIIRSPFKMWLFSEEMLYVMLICCIFYTIIIVYKPVKDLLCK